MSNKTTRRQFLKTMGRFLLLPTPTASILALASSTASSYKAPAPQVHEPRFCPNIPRQYIIEKMLTEATVRTQNTLNSNATATLFKYTTTKNITHLICIMSSHQNENQGNPIDVTPDKYQYIEFKENGNHQETFRAFPITHSSSNCGKTTIDANKLILDHTIAYIPNPDQLLLNKALDLNNLMGRYTNSQRSNNQPKTRVGIMAGFPDAIKQESIAYIHCNENENRVKISKISSYGSNDPLYLGSSGSFILDLYTGEPLAIFVAINIDYDKIGCDGYPTNIGYGVKFSNIVPELNEVIKQIEQGNIHYKNVTKETQLCTKSHKFIPEYSGMQPETGNL